MSVGEQSSASAQAIRSVSWLDRNSPVATNIAGVFRDIQSGQDGPPCMVVLNKQHASFSAAQVVQDLGAQLTALFQAFGGVAGIAMTILGRARARQPLNLGPGPLRVRDWRKE